ncbi:type II toxin-antitoxin system HicB family antitoxin [Roseomonas sp. GC11]|uniref:type II toxin-antitoxin system HicB family antitoxin n=1 Tax=Roseomonas sp. GC11 TaxID=2950546 RepID=UPI002108602E|nr:type II toxin-antitoxin system HicB family antitoxin [Roseomonas sp. GC11]MCQ4163006.1 type II toxin-antitoxin system HicB family antitoxin [Roseomonas sp. GC11]
MAIRYYVAILERLRDGFSVHFPDIGGCTSAGNTVEEAAANAEQALAMHLGSMLRDGDDIPPPRPIEQIPHDPEVDEYMRLLVRADLPGKAIRINITMDEGLLAAVDAAAKRQGQTRSGFLAEAARVALRA